MSMVFKVIIKHPSVDDDEHNYWGMVFLRDGTSQVKKLEYSEAESNLQNEFVFEGPVQPNENYLAVLLAVKESEKIEDPRFKIQFNQPEHVPEIVEFPYI
jgi:hypothetical protein